MNNFVKSKRLKYIFPFFVIILIFIYIFNIVISNSYLYADDNLPLSELNFSSNFNAESTNLNINLKKIDSNISLTDKRSYVLDQFFKAYNSPLYGYGNVFVKACEAYGAPEDCLTVAAIAKHETNLCTYQYSAEMFNCWGFGGGDGYRKKFNSFEESIDIVTQVLAQQYGRKYMINPSLMENTFCGTIDPLCEGWGNRIKSIMYDINEFSKSINMGDLFSLRH